MDAASAPLSTGLSAIWSVKSRVVPTRLAGPLRSTRCSSALKVFESGKTSMAAGGGLTASVPSADAEIAAK